MEKRINRLNHIYFFSDFLGEGFDGCLEGFMIVDILFPSMKFVLKWWSQFYCLFYMETIAVLYYAVFIFFYVHKMFNCGISIQVCRRHLFLILCNMLKVPDHQVAGHQAGDGKLGPLIDDSGKFYKPIQSDGRGSIEVAFYTSLVSSDTNIPNHIRRFFPIFHGTKLIEASDGSGQQLHLVLQDIVSGHLNPSIMDIKIGSRTWYPQASEDYIQRCFMKDRETSSLTLGFRISGLQIESKGSGFWKPDRKLIQKFTAEEVRLVLRQFVSSNSSADSGVDPDCTFVSTVYGGSGGILAQLLELKEWFEHQTILHFYSCSVLMVYEKESVVKEMSSGAEVKLVDFAHVVKGNGVIDHNFLGGLCSLINFISEILTCSDVHTAKASLQDPKNNCYTNCDTQN